MPIIVNATGEEITLRLRGNYFSWKPGQRKVIRDESLAHFIKTDRADQGLAVIPEVVADNEELTEEELAVRKIEVKAIEEREVAQALDRYVQRHRKIIANNQISLRRDLEQANIKADPAVFASEGELNSMRLVAKYQKSAEDKEALKMQEVKKLMDQVKKGN